MAIKAKIQFLTGEQKGKVLNVEKLPLIIGRMEGCDLLLAGDHQVSRRHAEIHYDGGRVMITDLGSSLGTLVNQKKIGGEQPLQSGDIIGVGNYQLKIALPTAPVAAKAAVKATEAQEGTAFVDMEKLVGGGGQEGTAFVDMEKMVEAAPAAQDGTGAVDMSRLVGKKTLRERWKALPAKKRILLGGAGGVVTIALLAAIVATLIPKEKPPVSEETVSVKVGERKKVIVQKARDVTSANPKLCEAWISEGNDSIALLEGMDEGDTSVTVQTWGGVRHVYPVTVEGYEDPYKGYDPQQRLKMGKEKMAEGDAKSIQAQTLKGELFHAYQAYHMAYQLFHGCALCPAEQVKEAEEKMRGQKEKLQTETDKYEKEFSAGYDLEDWNRCMLALQSLIQLYPDKNDPKHERYGYKLRIMEEKKAGHM